MGINTFWRESVIDEVNTFANAPFDRSFTLNVQKRDQDRSYIFFKIFYSHHMKGIDKVQCFYHDDFAGQKAHRDSYGWRTDKSICSQEVMLFECLPNQVTDQSFDLGIGLETCASRDQYQSVWDGMAEFGFLALRYISLIT